MASFWLDNVSFFLAGGPISSRIYIFTGRYQRITSTIGNTNYPSPPFYSFNQVILESQHHLFNRSVCVRAAILASCCSSVTKFQIFDWGFYGSCRTPLSINHSLCWSQLPSYILMLNHLSLIVIRYNVATQHNLWSSCTRCNWSLLLCILTNLSVKW